MAIVSLVALGTFTALLLSLDAVERGRLETVATGYLEEGVQAARSIRDRDWGELVNGTHGLTTAVGYYAFQGDPESLRNGSYTRTLLVEDVYRTDGLEGAIAETGTLDPGAKQVTVTLETSEPFQNIPRRWESVVYVFNWLISAWTQTTRTDFEAGRRHGTQIQNAEGGEVLLESADPAWKKALLAYTLNLDGDGDRIAAAVDASQDLLYVLSTSTSGNELQAFDVSGDSDAAPTVVRGAEFGGITFTDMAVANGYAYLSSVQDGAEVTIVSLTSMVTVGTLDLSGTADALALAVSESTLGIVRAASGQPEVTFYDVSDPLASLPLLGTTELGITPTDIAFSPTHAFVATTANNEEISVISRSSFVRTRAVNLSGNDDTLSLEWRDDRLYVGRTSGSSQEFAILDASDPDAGLPLLGSLELNASVRDIALDPETTFAFVATSSDAGELMVLNLDPLVLASSGDISGTDDARSIAFSGGRAYVGGQANAADLNVFEAGQGGWDAPVRVGSANKSGTHDVRSVFVDGAYLYIGTLSTSSDREFFIYDVSNAAVPVLRGSFEIGGTVSDIVVSNGYAYLATSQNTRELDIIDVRSKTAPVRAGSYDAQGSQDGFSVALSGTTAYLGRQTGSPNELFVLNVTNPAAPTLRGSLGFNGNINDLVVDSSWLYAATSDDARELAVFNVSNPAVPVLTSAANANGTADGRALAKSGSLVLVGRADSADGELLLVSVQNPSSPVVSSQTQAASAVNAVAFQSTTFVFVGLDADNAEVQRWDLSVPSSPLLRSSFDADADANAVFFNGTYAFLGTEHDTLDAQIVGPGPAATGYTQDGTITSTAFDAGYDATDWLSAAWTVSGTGSVELRIRTAATESSLADAVWTGPDGTPDTAYAVSGEAMQSDPNATGSRWIQWKGFLRGDGTSTPVLEDVTLRFSH